MSIDHQQLANSLDKLPAFPQSVNKILELTAKIDVAPKDLVSVIERDVVLTARVLKLVNSSYFGLSREVTSVQHAVVYIGINTIKNVALSVAMSGSLPKKNKAGLDMDKFWQQSLSVGVIAKLLAERNGISSNQTGDYFVAGLLHNIGKIVFAHFYPEEYQQVLISIEERKVPAFKIEKELLGVDHSEIGAMLAEAWKLPENLINGIRNHHNSEQKITEKCISMSIFTASQIYKRIHQVESEIIEIPDEVEKWLGCSIEQVIASLDQLDQEIEKALVFINQ